MPDPTALEPLIDPDCRDGKCGSCVGGPCEHACHIPPGPGIVTLDTGQSIVLAQPAALADTNPAEDELARLRALLAERGAELDRVTRAAETAEGNAQSYWERKVAAEIERNNLRREVAALKAALETGGAERDSLRNRITALTTNGNELTARLEDAENELADWRLARSKLGRWWEWPLVQAWWYRQYRRRDRRAFERECAEIRMDGGE